MIEIHTREAMARCLSDAGVQEFCHSSVREEAGNLVFEIYGDANDAAQVHAALREGGYVGDFVSATPVDGTTRIEIKAALAD